MVPLLKIWQLWQANKKAVVLGIFDRGLQTTKKIGICCICQLAFSECDFTSPCGCTGTLDIASS